MSKLLERLKREREEKEQRRLERERKKIEREKEKKRIKKEKHKKAVRHKQNARYYKKKRAAVLKERAKIGDEKGYFMVLIMKDRKRMKKLGSATWKTDAYKIFNEAVEQNRREVKYPLKVFDRNDRGRKADHDIIIVQRVSSDDEIVTHFRDEDGRFVEHSVIDYSGYKIIDKAEWFIEETFSVYGYHPEKDRKDFTFILNELVLKDISPETSRNIFVYADKVFIQHNDYFDYIRCKSNREAERLYDAIYKAVDGNKYIVFTGRAPRELSRWIKDNIKEMTGRDI